MKKNKYLAFGSLIAIASPLSLVIACSPDGNKDDEKEEVVLDLADFNSPAELVKKMDETMHFAMSEDAASLSESDGNGLTAVGKKKILDYLNASDFSKSIKLIYQEDSIILDFSKLQEITDKLKNILSSDNLLKMSDVLFISGSLLSPGASAPEMMAITGHMMGVEYSMGMLGFMQIATSKLSEEHEYFSFLREWHKVVWKLSQSQVYQSWVEGKTYEIIQGGGNENKLQTINPGDLYDNLEESPITVVPLPDKHDGKLQTSNLEAQFLQEILNLKATLDK